MDLTAAEREDCGSARGLTMSESTEFPEAEPESDHESEPEQFFSWRTLLHNLPYIVALALAIFGVAYSSFTGSAINGYWEILAIATGIVCVLTGWPKAPDRPARLKLIWTQAAHWVTILVAMNLVLLQGVQQVLPIQATGLVLMLLLGIGTFLAGIHLLSLRICFLGFAMAMAIPGMTWLKQASLLLALGGVAVAGLAVAFWPRGRKAAA
jgi:hypothetical protein